LGALGGDDDEALPLPAFFAALFVVAAPATVSRHPAVRFRLVLSAMDPLTILLATAAVKLTIKAKLGMYGVQNIEEKRRGALCDIWSMICDYQSSSEALVGVGLVSRLLRLAVASSMARAYGTASRTHAMQWRTCYESVQLRQPPLSPADDLAEMRDDDVIGGGWFGGARGGHEEEGEEEPPLRRFWTFIKTRPLFAISGGLVDDEHLAEPKSWGGGWGEQGRTEDAADERAREETLRPSGWLSDWARHYRWRGHDKVACVPAMSLVGVLLVCSDGHARARQLCRPGGAASGSEVGAPRAALTAVELTRLGECALLPVPPLMCDTAAGAPCAAHVHAVPIFVAKGAWPGFYTGKRPTATATCVSAPPSESDV
jgi:hypothetical protein